MLWNIFNTLQIIMALPLMMVNYPSNISTIIETFDGIVNFEIIPKDFLYDEIAVPVFGLESSD